MQKNTDIWITANGDNLDIDVLLDGIEDIDVVMAGTSLFNPTMEVDPIIKDYLEHPNDLTIIYLGGSPITSNSYTHTQGVGSMTWNINHGLNRAGVIIQCFDNNKKEIKAEIQHIDNNNSTAKFGLVISGTAECR
jgi:hypothetical protein